jgi:subtilase family serine protease
LTYIERHTLNGETTRQFETTSEPELRCGNIVSVVFFSVDAPGEYVCEITLDANNAIAEEDELNNHAVKPFTVIAVPSS